MANQESNWITKDEMRRVIRAFLDGNGASTLKDITAAVNWAEGVRIDEGFLTLVLSGEVTMSLQKNGEMLFQSRAVAEAS